MKQFTVKKSYEEVEIEGEVYKIDLNDNKLKSYMLEGHKLKEEADKILDMSEDATAEEIEKGLDEVKELTKQATDSVLGKGAFDNIYPKTGPSINNMADVLFQVIDYLNEKQKEDLDKQKAKYTKKKKR
ncbi:hypothetical protein [Oceanobacillus sp. CF4.6]|uniref:hypothetical protein n=1 Tax=Oceanobacillus sp. CF4.6 TaxID=3373080 RepID=UPI003EE68C70